jgi:hypothetical protein
MQYALCLASPNHAEQALGNAGSHFRPDRDFERTGATFIDRIQSNDRAIL